MCTFKYNDGGRSAAIGKEDKAADCVARALAIATGISYSEISNMLVQGIQSRRKTKKLRRWMQHNRFSSMSDVNVDKGIKRDQWIKQFIIDLGFEWIPTMKIGSGCKVHLKAEELPQGTIICQVSKHLVTVIDGEINDTYDPSRSGTRCVYGYYQKKR